MKVFEIIYTQKHTNFYFSTVSLAVNLMEIH